MTTLNDIAGNISADTLKANAELFKTLPPELQAYVPRVPGEPTKADIKCEKDLQNNCQNLMIQRGYWKLTDKNIDRVLSEDVLLTGWWGHLHRPQKNIIMPDLFCFDRANTRPAFLAELKYGRSPRWQPGQKELVDMGFWRLFSDYDEFATAFTAWEQGIGRK